MKPYFELGGVTLYHGDCLEIMPLLTDNFDMCLTDPPYGTTACKWDSVIPFEPMWENLKRLVKKNGAIVMTASQPFTSALVMSNSKMFRYCWVWDGVRAANFAQAPYMPLKNCEDVVVFSEATIAANSKNRMIYNPQGLVSINKICPGKKANAHRPNRVDQKPYMQSKTGYPNQILTFPKDSKPIHPTQKPVALMEYLIKTYTNEGDLILDFTCGSGTTLVAAQNLNRRCVGIEMSKEYCDIVVDRLTPGF